MAITSFYMTGILSNIPSFMQNESGEIVKTSGVTYDISGRIRPMTGDEIIVAEKLNMISTHILYCPVGSEINDTSIIIDGANSYNVKFIKNPMSMNHHLEIWIKLL